jgi:hypothetical protein
MGIPGLFQQIEKQHPEFLHPSPPSSIDVLTWDFNALLYNAYHQVRQFHNPAEYDSFANQLLATVKKEMDKTVQDYKPSHVLYIALDGVVPQQKMAEQRVRRSSRYLERSWFPFLEANAPISQKKKLPFVSSSVMKVEEMNHSGEFTTLEFTPGSRFYVKLHDFLLLHIEETYHKKMKIPEVYYDSPFTPGEAEQKILQWVQKTIPATDTDTNIYLISKDADLLVLPFHLRPRVIYILREMESRFERRLSEVWGMSIQDLPAYMTIDLPKLYEFYIETTRREVKEVAEWEAEALFRDQEILTFFMGNDFVKPIVFLTSTWRDSQEIIQRAYRAALQQTRGQSPLVIWDAKGKHWTLQMRVFVAFLSELARQEADLIGEFVKMMLEKGKRQRRREEGEDLPTFGEWMTHLDFTNVEHPWSPLMLPLLHKVESMVREDRKDCENGRLSDEVAQEVRALLAPSAPQTAEECVHDYLQTVQFNIEYYLKYEPPSWVGVREMAVAPFPSEILRWVWTQPVFMEKEPQELKLWDVVPLSKKTWPDWSKTPMRPLENFLCVLPDVPQFDAKPWIPGSLGKRWDAWWKKRTFPGTLEPNVVLEPPCDVGTAGKWEHKTLWFHLPEWDVGARLGMMRQVMKNGNRSSLRENEKLDVFLFQW